MKNLSEQHP